MFDSPIFDVAIGLILVYLVLSMLCSAAQEWIASLFSLRAANLEAGIKNLLSDPVAKQFYQHGLVKGLARKTGRPSYIPSRVFTSALMDLATKGKSSQPFAEIRKGLAKVENDDLKQALLALADQAGNEVDRFKELVAQWFDDAMDRVSGWYVRKAKAILFLVAAAVTVTINADSIRIAGTIWTNETLREQLVALGTAFHEEGQPAAGSGGGMPLVAPESIDATLALLPIGWQCGDGAGAVCLSGNLGWSSLPGWLITIAAVSFGAPFWFDLLGRVVRLRGAGGKPKPRGEGV